MKLLRNLPLAARLGVAFGALGLGLLVVALTAIVSVGRMNGEVETLANDHLRATQLVGAVGQRVKGAGHDVVEHLYVFDGDLEAQDALQAVIEESEEANERADAQLKRILEGTDAAAPLDAFDRAEAEFFTTAKAALEASRQETVDEVEE